MPFAMLNQNTTGDFIAQNMNVQSESNYYTPMNPIVSDIATEAMNLLLPETQLEKDFLKDAEFLTGLNWGKPRFGHPEGKVLYHIREVLDNVDSLCVDAEMRRKLRVITFVHDTFKHLEDRNRPRNWSKHHAALGRNFLANITNEKALLEVTARHDDAYYAWRAIHLYQKKEIGQQQINNLVSTIGEDLQLYYLFFKCDTQTGDKIQAPVKWFEETIKNIDIVNF